MRSRFNKLGGESTRAGFWSLGEALIWPLGLLALAPIVIRLHGVQAYGVLVFFNAVLAAVPILTLGLQVVLIQAMSSASGTQRSAAQLIPAEVAWVGIAAAMLAGVLTVGVVGAGSGLWLTELRAATHDAAVWPYVVSMGVASTAICLDQATIGILKGLSRFRTCAQIEFAGRTAQILCVCTSAWISVDITAIIASLSAAMLLTSVSRLMATLECISPVRPIMVGPLARQLLQRGCGVVLQIAGGYAYMGLDRLIIGAVVGPALLGVYALFVQAAQFAHLLSSALFQPLLPAFSRFVQDTDRAGATRLLVRANAAAILFAVIVGLALWVTGLYLLPIWLNRPLSDQEILAYALAIVSSGITGSVVPAHYFWLANGAFMRVGALNIVAGLVLTLSLVMAVTASQSLALLMALRFTFGAILAAGYLALWAWSRRFR